MVIRKYAGIKNSSWQKLGDLIAQHMLELIGSQKFDSYKSKGLIGRMINEYIDVFPSLRYHVYFIDFTDMKEFMSYRGQDKGYPEYILPTTYHEGYYSCLFPNIDLVVDYKEAYTEFITLRPYAHKDWRCHVLVGETQEPGVFGFVLGDRHP